jgi:uncharacterized membrane protein
MNRYVAVGLTAVAGAALIEAALVPGLLIGGAAVLAPRYVPGLRRGLWLLGALVPARKPASQPVVLSIPARLGLKQAVVKTITFRIVATSLDFTSNYIVIGSVATAAGLSAFALAAGPVFYFLHETLWNYHADPAAGPVHVRMPIGAGAGREFAISRALAKTITFRTVATVMDFSVTFWTVRDLPTAAGLATFGFVVGPFVYWGHEKVWDTLSRRDDRAAALAPPAPPAGLGTLNK